jgi:hypothetical protein
MMAGVIFVSACVIVLVMFWQLLFLPVIAGDKLAQIQPGMNAGQVEAILGRPASIEQSETADQTLSGEVDHYPAPNGEGRVIFVNHAVFKAEFIPGAKS